MIAYKLLRVRKDKTVGPIFINKQLVIKVGEWMDAESHPTKGFQVRPGWHVMAKPEAPHLSIKGRAWYSVEVEAAVEYNRPESQGGKWFLASRMKLVAPVSRSVKTVNYIPKQKIKKELAK